ncbi:MAG: T9SS type A sorting domain-containing protein [Bacteroidia bacterium]|nr:T9SS type A sorting domain-containing protein [Bacteroidia bacterium]
MQLVLPCGLISELVVYSPNGQVILSQKVKALSASINTVDMPEGIYLVQVKTKDGVVLRKFSIVR